MDSIFFKKKYIDNHYVKIFKGIPTNKVKKN